MRKKQLPNCLMHLMPPNSTEFPPEVKYCALFARAVKAGNSPNIFHSCYKAMLYYIENCS